MPDFLGTMAVSSHRRAREAKSIRSEAEIRRRLGDLPDPPRLLPNLNGFDLIAEVKRKSPSIGSLGGERIVERARAYATAGAAAVSVLTEPDAFGGSLDDLARISDALDEARRDGFGRPIPAMRKDFLTDPYQLLESRVNGAGGALLILRILPESQLSEMLSAAAEADLFVLVEAFDADELHRAGAAVEQAAALGVEALVGLNCRDLQDLEVQPARFMELSDQFPRGVPKVAESGIGCVSDVARVSSCGYDLALIGTALMRTPRPGPAIADMLAAGRAARELGRIGRFDDPAGNGAGSVRPEA